MKRRDLLIGGLAAATGAGRSAARADKPKRSLAFVGPAWTEPTIPGSTTSPSAAFYAELGRRGYIEGENLRVHQREGLYERWPQIVYEVVGLKPDVIVVSSVFWALRFRVTNTNIPIVVSASSPVEQDLVPSLGKPGSTITGVASDTGPTFQGKQIDLLLQAAPASSHVGCLAGASPYMGMRELWSEANRRGVSVQEFHHRGGQYEDAFTAMTRDGANAVLVLAEADHVARPSIIAELAKRHRLPLVSPFRRLTEAGALMSYGVDWEDIDRRLAVYAARILDGAKPSELPFEQPGKFEFILNLQAAKHLGLSLPPYLVARADELFEGNGPL